MSLRSPRFTPGRIWRSTSDGRLKRLARRVPTWGIYSLGLVPLAFWSGGRSAGGLGVDPVKAIEHRLGELGLQFLLASLAITPLRRLGLNLIRFRRALGLLAFGYVALHLAWPGSGSTWACAGARWRPILLSGPM